MKFCMDCHTEKEVEQFNMSSVTLDGLTNYCKVCLNNRAKKIRRTKNGLTLSIYNRQKESSRKRGHHQPLYTLQQLRDWVFSQTNFELLYGNWVKSGYKKALVPSIDRLDDYKGYSFDNIQLITWEENKQKGYRDRRSGKNCIGMIPVIGVHKQTGERFEFYSTSQAIRETGAHKRQVNQGCVCGRNTSGKYNWSYKS